MGENNYIYECDGKRFEWDPNKHTENVVKHGVSFETAAKVFSDDDRVEFDDEKHSGAEDRLYCVGHDGYGVLTVRYTIRNEIPRIIGAGYWRKGRQMYEQRKENHLHGPSAGDRRGA